MIERTFRDIPEGKVSEADRQSFLVGLGWSQGITWDDLLQSKRVLMISEAGAGKTYECRAQAQRLWKAGEPAFFVELAALATEDFRDLLDPDEEARLAAWLSSQSDMATFFLDSLDELKLTLGSFERALKRFKKGIGNQLHRTRIVITARPIPFDEQLVRNILPVPPASSSEPIEEIFAEIAMREHSKHRDDNGISRSREWRSVALMPLSDEQIIAFSRNQHVKDPGALLEVLRCRNAQEFARRPQDLIELCADWHDHKRIRTHRDQVKTNIRVKLLPRDDRGERAELSIDNAMEGASRLALAMQMTRRLTIRHNAASDAVDEAAALDPAVILSDWHPNERKALLERPLFGFASYGRVRFHHRSVAEYLAAERLSMLRKRGMSFRALKRLIFAETKGKTIVRPSKRPVAGWLALKERGVFELLRDNEPAVLLNEGDPESLMQTQRNQALSAYSDRYRLGGWRGLQVPEIQVHRFASKELAGEINRIWQSGVENPDVREVLISIIEAGCIDSCADIVFQVACDVGASMEERIKSIDALVALDDRRLDGIVTAIAAADSHWPDRLARFAINRLFPKYMLVDQLCQALRWIKLDADGMVNLAWQLPRTIVTSKLDYSIAEKLRDGIVELISEELMRTKAWQLTSDHLALNETLAAVCEYGLDVSQSDEWLKASVLSLRLHYRDSRKYVSINSLRNRLEGLNADSTERLFWITDGLLQSIRKLNDPRKRFFAIIADNGPFRLRSDRDLAWVSDSLGDTKRNFGERAILLEAALQLAPDPSSRRKHGEGLKSHVVDEHSFVEWIDDWIKPSKLEKQLAKQKRQWDRREAKVRDRWVSFWHEISNHPADAFSSERCRTTAWILCRAIHDERDDSPLPGWNRPFVEKHFDKETSDRLRGVLMKVWREDPPTLPSNIPEGDCNSLRARSQFSLAAISAEAEDSDWADKISDEEARLAARIALNKLGDLPQWIEALAVVHPTAIDQTLGNELSRELNQAPEAHGNLEVVQRIGYALKNVARIFLPRLEAWLDQCGDRINDTDNATRMTERVRQVTSVILQHGDGAARAKLQKTALQRLRQRLPCELCLVWLSTLMRIDPSAGVDMLEDQIKTVEPAERSDAVTWLAGLFGYRREKIYLGDKGFTPQLLLRLLRLAYRHVRIQDDAQHKRSYSRDIRDTRNDAEQVRNRILSALLASKGEEGWAAKLELAADPLCSKFKDRILAVAEENWAQEIDSDVLDEQQAVAFEQNCEVPATTNETMFSIMKDRLSDLEDTLLHDDSPREEWAGIKVEKVMRRAIARELRHAANSIYTVDQEAVTADEKETDIRLCSTASAHEAVIEIKLGDKHSAKDLRDAIENQLVKKYMAAENRRSGALLVTLAKDRTWKHPDGNGSINVDELRSLLRKEAERVQEALGGDIRLEVHFLDLRLRLPLENKKEPIKAKTRHAE